ncbi:type II toxin-antitoxin system HipA family toxin [Duganella sp. FT80W]|uniref:Type II toxin-antitoxin system HipA family toxin n=1 Tax=Duganella guangzhouensis TaxID=2666084 RepID=A0A6I2L4U9_9BURK|nr:type II toxin-antitoxin system HipA family toxin [Duganella guangzhouensis]MRW92772.1 type II toxin-antitoxin system HipA family toxin [Duganella guangzhouensis]
MKVLSVSYNGWGEHWPLGTLADNGHDILFEYSPEALRRGIELSPRHLPLRVIAFGGAPRHQHSLPGLFADSLPDGWGQLLMDRLRGQTRVSPLDRLAFIGEHGMGALSYHPATTREATTPDLAAADHLAELANAAQAIGRGEPHPLLGQLALLGAAPQGSRPKLLLSLPDEDGAGSQPWLIKFPAHDEHKEVCAIEQVYAELARACGLEVADTRHIDLGRRHAAIASRRFDREDGLRVPVHTLAGLLHADFRLPSVDYSTFLRATRLITRDQRQVEAAFQRCVFNVLFQHRGDHAHNITYRMNRKGDWQLAPCYGLGYSHGPLGQHQMPVMGECAAPARDHLLRLATDTAVPERRARDLIAAMTAQAGLFAKLARHAPIRAATAKTIARTIAANRERLRGA